MTTQHESSAARMARLRASKGAGPTWDEREAQMRQAEYRAYDPAAIAKAARRTYAALKAQHGEGRLRALWCFAVNHGLDPAEHVARAAVARGIVDARMEVRMSY